MVAREGDPDVATAGTEMGERGEGLARLGGVLAWVVADDAEGGVNARMEGARSGGYA